MAYSVNSTWYSNAVTYGGLNWILIMPPVNWQSGVTVRHFWSRSLVERTTGLEQRASEQAAMRLRQRYVSLLDGVSAQSFRGLLGALGESRVLIPLWADVRDSANWSSRGYDAECNAAVTLNSSGAVTAVTLFDNGASLPIGATFYAPLLAGRLQRTRENLLKPDLFSVEIDVVEDSPWAFRVGAKQTAPEGWEWPINWRGRGEESSRDLLTPLRYEAGREVPLDGEAVSKWQQKGSVLAVEGEWQELLAFWADKSGSQESITWESLATPGAETAQAPHDFDGTSGKGTMRLSDIIELRFSSPNAVTAEIAVEQVLDSVATQVSDPRTKLIKLALNVDGEETGAVYYTPWDAPISALSQTWVSMSGKISVSRLRQSLRPQNESVTVKCKITDIPYAEAIAKSQLEYPITLTLYDCVLSDPIATELRFRGTLKATSIVGQEITMEFSLFGGLFERRLPRYEYTRTCNKTIYDANCAKTRPTEMALTEWKWTGDYKDFWADNKLLLENITAPEEIELTEEKLKGVIFAVASLKNANPPLNAFDGFDDTFFAAADADGSWIAMDVQHRVRVTTIKYRPRLGFEARLDGAKFQGANLGDFSDAVDLHTISGTPTQALHTVNPADTGRYSYIRLLGANGNYCDVAELEFYGRRLIKPASPDGGYFAGGWVATGTGATRQVRPILDSFTVPGEIHLLLNRPFLGDISEATFEFWPGCNGSIFQCRGKFANERNYGAFPHIPDYVTEATQNIKGGK